MNWRRGLQRVRPTIPTIIHFFQTVQLRGFSESDAQDCSRSKDGWGEDKTITTTRVSTDGGGFHLYYVFFDSIRLRRLANQHNRQFFDKGVCWSVGSVGAVGRSEFTILGCTAAAACRGSTMLHSVIPGENEPDNLSPCRNDESRKVYLYRVSAVVAPSKSSSHSCMMQANKMALICQTLERKLPST